jgi:PAS domain S-box-containing protein
MSRSSPQALALREPAAVLLLVSVPGAATGELLALDATARAAAGVAEGEPPPRDLRHFLRRAGLVADPVWDRLERGEVVAGARLPGDLWVSAGRVPDHDQLLVVVVRTHAVDRAGHDDTRGVVAAGPGTALSALREGHLVVDWIDGAFTRTTGAAAHDVLGRSWEELLGTRDEAALADLTRSVSPARPTTVTVLDHRADGTAFLHEVRTVPLLDRTGAVRHVVSRHSDVTRRTAEASATDRTAERRAATRLEVLGRLDAVVLDEDLTHGIRSVVRVLGDHLVSAAMVVLLREGPGGAATEVEVVAAHGPRLHGLVGHRLRRSRQAGPDPLLDPAAPDTGEPLEIAALDAPPGPAPAGSGERRRRPRGRPAPRGARARGPHRARRGGAPRGVAGGERAPARPRARAGRDAAAQHAAGRDGPRRDRGPRRLDVLRLQRRARPGRR